jgi:hypothetical protein
MARIRVATNLDRDAVCEGQAVARLAARLLSEQPKTRPKVPEGKARFVTTRQQEPNEKGFVGHETTWEPFQKEVEYTTPKRP